MLIYDNSTELGDRNVKDQESVAKLKEKIQHYRDDNHQIPDLEGKKNPDYIKTISNQEMALGNPMSPALFSEKLRKLGFIVEPGGMPNAVAVRRVILDTDATSPTFNTYIKKYVSGFYTNRVLPEFSSVTKDRFGVPLREIRGWRNVLLMIHLQGYLTLQELKAAFGDANGPRSDQWRRDTAHER